MCKIGEQLQNWMAMHLTEIKQDDVGLDAAHAQCHLVMLKELRIHANGCDHCARAFDRRVAA